MCIIIYEYTVRCVPIDNFVDIVYNLQLDAYCMVPLAIDTPDYAATFSLQ